MTSAIPRWLDVARLRLRSLLGRDQLDVELDRELRAHLDAQVEENIDRGMSPADARRAAVAHFGGVEHAREGSRDARGVAWLENLTRDLRYTLRGVVREPMLLTAAATSIALGAAGNIAVFSLARAFLFATPDVRAPREVVHMRVSHGSHATYQRWSDLQASGALPHFAGFSFERPINWYTGSAAVSITPMLVTANYFDVLGVPIARGRAFSTTEARAELDPHLAVITHAFWQRELGGDSAVLGRSLLLNGEPYTILGVIADRARSPAGWAIAPSIYLPINRSLVPDIASPDARIIQLLGRLGPDQTVDEARAAVDAADRRLARLAGDSLYGGVQAFARVGTMSGKAGRIVGSFFALLGIVSVLVLLIACANVAGLLVARGMARRREVAIRLAIGGTRARLLQQMLAEGFWLSLIGTIGGLALSLVAMRVLNSLALPIPIPIALHLSVDAGVLACALVLVVATMIACALLPALGATRPSVTAALKRDDPRGRGRRFSTRGVLLVGQVTVSTLLLVTAFLFLRNLMRSQITSPGFDVEPLMVARVGFIQGGPSANQTALIERFAERLRALPGVTSVATSGVLPLTIYSGSHNGRSVRLDDSASTRHMEYSEAAVGSGFFATMGIPVIAGREFRNADRAGAPAVAIVNAELARRFFGGNAVGHRLRFAEELDSVDVEIVGVVATSKYRTIGEEADPALYFPLRQRTDRMDVAFVMVRSALPPSALITPASRAIGEIDRSVAAEIVPMRDALAFALLPSRIGAGILGGLGVLGLILAAFGLYAIVSYNVSRRTGEIAIRTALGASRQRIVRLVIADAFMLVGVGVVSGLGIAALATRALDAFLVAGLSATDPVSFLAAGAVFAFVTLLASWFPARQATRLSPAMAMRLE